jgi:homopolymeric O-antigen transport system ATP-binding protein
MSPPALRVESLSKRYQIGRPGQTAAYRTLRDALTEAVTEPVRRLRRRSMQTPAEATLWALKDVSFDVQPGDVVGVIGRNGAGKSTLLKILSRVTQPTHGRIVVNGRVGSLLEVGTGFHPELTGRENIYLNGSILGMTARDIRHSFDEIVQFAEVDRFLDTPVKRYSSGMQMRLAFAVAAHFKPEILVVDEVLAVGDAEFQKKCLGKMQDLADRGRTVLFVSHNEAAIRRLCTSAILLQSGQVRCTGTPEEVFRSYRAQGSTPGFSTANRTCRGQTIQFADAYLCIDGMPTSEIVSGSAPTLTCLLEIASRVRFSLEYILRNSDSLPIMFAPLGLSQRIDYTLDPGLYEVRHCLKLPYLASGKYTLDLILAETGIGFYDQIEEGLTFYVSESNHPATGWQFRQTRGQGSILLDVEEMGAPCKQPT